MLGVGHKILRYISVGGGGRVGGVRGGGRGRKGVILQILEERKGRNDGRKKRTEGRNGRKDGRNVVVEGRKEGRKERRTQLRSPHTRQMPEPGFRCYRELPSRRERKGRKAPLVLLKLSFPSLSLYTPEGKRLETNSLVWSQR
jgi:hypothetical protein